MNLRCSCTYFFFLIVVFCVIVCVLCVLYTLLYLEEIKDLSIFCSYLYSFCGIFYACIVCILCEPPSHKFVWPWCLHGDCLVVLVALIN